MHNQPDWLEFEYEMRELVTAFGYQAASTPPTGDFGVDVLAHNQRHIVVVQCKLYSRGRIGGDTMMKLVGSRQYFKATDAVCITTSHFTKQAKEIAAKEDIKLVDCERLILLCRERNLTIPSLTVLATNNNHVLGLQQFETTIGRDSNNHVHVPSAVASRRHAVLKRQNLFLTIEDCGSTNGTEVNEQRIVHCASLNYFERITLGGAILKVAMKLPGGVIRTSL